MAETNLKGIFIGFVLFLFIVAAGGNILSGMQTQYAPGTDGQADFSNYATNNFTNVVNTAETKSRDAKGLTAGLEAVGSTIGTFLSLLNGKSDIDGAVSGDTTRNTLWFIPNEVWVTISLLLTIVIVVLTITFFWRSKEGIN
jgi:hypothetical protein